MSQPFEINIYSNLGKTVSELEEMSASYERAIEAGVATVTESVLGRTTQRVREIASMPIPLNSRGQPAWIRTGALAAAETSLKISPSERLITTQNAGVAGKNPEQYAEVRHELKTRPKPWRKEG